MIQAFLPGALTIALLTTPAVTAPVTPSAQFFTPSSAVNQKLIWVVKPGENLLTIAKEYYGDEKYWTTLWNDNDFISDPSAIEPDEVLILRPKAPKEQEDIKQSLKDKHPEISYTTVDPLSASSDAAPVVTPAPVVTEAPVIQPPLPSPTVAPVTSAPVVSSYTGGPLSEAQITFLGNCESGMTATRNSGNGYYGAFQFSIGTWNSMGTGYERADLAPLDVQKDAVQRLLTRSSIYTQFPGCSRKMQAAGLL